MAHNNVVTWTCDRCGRTVGMETQIPPSGWVEVTADQISVNDQADRTWEICGGCYSQIERMLMNQRDVEAA